MKDRIKIWEEKAARMIAERYSHLTDEAKEAIRELIIEQEKDKYLIIERSKKVHKDTVDQYSDLIAELKIERNDWKEKASKLQAKK